MQSCVEGGDDPGLNEVEWIEQGDDPVKLAHDFCRVHELSAESERKLIHMLKEQIPGAAFESPTPRQG